jgi:threonine aldolase
MGTFIDFRSDTVTLPPEGMRLAMAAAELGDDVYGEDPTVNALESQIAEMLGKECSLFLPTGTMANLLALLALCSDRKRILVGDLSDIWRWEAGGASALGGLLYHPIATRPDGGLDITNLEDALYGQEDFQCVAAQTICLEDTHCLCGGTVLSLAYLESVCEFSQAHKLSLHLDGARLFHAALALDVAVDRIAQFADTVTVCLSKGLSAPVGSLLAGPSDVIHAARRLRKMLGGGWRQAGVLAAAGIYAVDHMIGRLREDHANAAYLADGLSTIPGIVLETKCPQTNIVFWRLADPRTSVQAFILALEERGVRVMELGKGRIRAVTHFGITRENIASALQAIPSALRAYRHPEPELINHVPMPKLSRFESVNSLNCEAETK